MRNIESGERIIQELDDYPIKDQIEILANTLVSIGISWMNLKEDVEINEKNIVNILLKYKKQKGETLEGALVQQGLNMLIWLDNVRTK